jgi:hypothetical protein
MMMRRFLDSFKRKFGSAGTSVRVVNSSTGKVERTITVPYRSHLEFELVNEIGHIVTCRAFLGTWTAWFGVTGYGNLTDVDEQATQVAIDVYHHNMPDDFYQGRKHSSAGHAQILLWPDVNEEEPDSVSLELARVGNREPEEEYNDS